IAAMAKRHTHAERVDRSRLFMTLLSFPDRRRLTAANVAPRGPFQTHGKRNPGTECGRDALRWARRPRAAGVHELRYSEAAMNRRTQPPQIRCRDCICRISSVKQRGDWTQG